MWDLIWTLWVAAILVSFAIFETLAIKRPGGKTLSRFVWEVSKAWPPLPFVLGLLVGGLAVHFWWPWCPV